METPFRLAIAAPNSPAGVETFIALQMERLPCVLKIFGTPVATETTPGGPIASRGNLADLWHLATGRGSKVPWRHQVQASAVKRRLLQSRAQVLLANFGPCAVALQPVAEAAGIPLVAHFHGYDAHATSTVAKMAPAYRTLGAQAAAFIVVSEGMRSALVDFGIPPEKIHLARCGADPTRFTPRTHPPATPLFLGVGRFVDKKAPYLTLLAFAKARQQLPTARLIMVGSGELLETCTNLSVALKLGDSVDFPGVLPPDRIAGLLRASTAFVQHSLEPRYGPLAGDREGTPVAILEAMMTAVPIISTRHAGIQETVVNGRSGLLVGERDVDGMAAAMVQLGSSTDLTLAMGNHGREDALTHHTADRYLETVRNIIADTLKPKSAVKAG